MSNVFKSVVAVVGLSAACFYIDTLPANAGTGDVIHGGIDVNEYCLDVHKTPGVSSELVNNTAEGWRCNVEGDLVRVDMAYACQTQYDRYKVRAVAQNDGDPYSWVCLTPGSVIFEGWLDMENNSPSNRR